MIHAKGKQVRPINYMNHTNSSQRDRGLDFHEPRGTAQIAVVGMLKAPDLMISKCIYYKLCISNVNVSGSETYFINEWHLSLVLPGLQKCTERHG